MALSVGDTYLVKSTGPVVMHIGFVAAVDGAGHQSGHFQLHQSYLPIRIRDEALVGGVTSLIGSAPVRETPQTQTPTPMLCRQPSVARVPRSFSQEEDWLSKACRSGARTSSTALTQRYEEEKLGTVQDTRRLTRLVLRLQPSESRASCCGSCFCHSRPSQRFTIREHVRLLWVFEDEKVLRAHNGVCYLYVDQSWEIFSGLISEVCLERVQQSMQALEGLLRSLPMGTFARYRELCGSRGAIVRGSGSCVWPRCAIRLPRRATTQMERITMSIGRRHLSLAMTPMLVHTGRGTYMLPKPCSVTLVPCRWNYLARDSYLTSRSGVARSTSLPKDSQPRILVGSSSTRVLPS